jgi:CPA2 family monovalent cation:H+ antiporter-2
VLLIAQQSSGGTALGLLIVLSTAGLIALLFNRLKLSTIPGYLIAGALIGPSALGLIKSPEATRDISQLATILLMFIIGMELDTSRVKSGLIPILAATIVSTGLSILLGWGLAAGFIPSAPGALVVAMAMSAAATAPPLHVMEKQRELNSTYGRLAFGITLFQDLIAVAMLTTLPLLALWAGVGREGEVDPQKLVRNGALAIAGLVAMVAVARFVLPRLLTEASRVSSEVLIVVSAAVALASAMFTAWLGFSPELGAFLAGITLASTPFRYQLAGQLSPLRDLFLAVFFTAVGLLLPFGEVVKGVHIVALGLAALIFMKVVGIGLGSWVLGASPRVALLTGFVLMPAGEFTLVMISHATNRGLLDERQSGYAIAVVVVSILICPTFAALGRRIAPKVDRVPNAPWFRQSALRDETPPATEEEGEPKFRAIIAGFGPVGRAVADALQAEGVEITVIELNPNTVQRQALLGRKIVYGDASNPGVLISAGLDTADAVILTMPDEEAMLRACRTVRALKKDVFIAARANALSKGLTAMQLGADHAVVEEMATAEAMGREVLLKVRDRIAGNNTGPRLYEYQT